MDSITYSPKEIFLPTRDSAEEVLSRLGDFCKKFGSASAADLYELCGLHGRYLDNHFGWKTVSEVKVKEVGKDFILDLPNPEELDYYIVPDNVVLSEN